MKISWKDASLKATPIRAPRDQTKTPRDLPVLHVLANSAVLEVRHLWVPTGWPTLYSNIPFRRLLQSGLSICPSIQGYATGLHCPKAHIQCEKNYHASHQSLPGPMPGLLSPRIVGIFTPRSNQRHRQYHSTVWCRCRWRSSSPHTHQDLHPRKRHANGHRKRQKNQITHDQRKVLPRNQAMPPTLTGTSCWQPVLKRLTTTLIILSLHKNSPVSSAPTPDLARHISEIEQMHKFSAVKIRDLSQARELFTHPEKVDPTKISNNKTTPSRGHKDNGNTLPLGTQTSLQDPPPTVA